MKTVVIGYTASGKTFVAKHIAEREGVNLLCLDDVHWVTEHKVRDYEEEKQLVSDFMKSSTNWVIEGNYEKVLFERRLREADRIVLLDFNRLDCLLHVVKSFVRNKIEAIKSTKTLANKEKLDITLLKRILFEERNEKLKNQFQSIKNEYREKVVIIENQEQLDAFCQDTALGQYGMSDMAKGQTKGSKTTRNSSGTYRKYASKKIHKIPMALLFPIVLFYYEVVFRISTVRGIFQWGTLFMLLFCFMYGVVGYLLYSIPKTKQKKFLVGGAVIGGMAVPFLIQYFVYRQFKIFYDLNTMFGGATDALTGFTNDIFALIFCFDGFFKIFLFLFPMALYFIIGKKYVRIQKSNGYKRVAAGVCMLLIYGFIRLTLMLSPSLSLLYGAEYNYQSAVGSFGLMTGMRMDVRENIFDDGDSFEDVNISVPTVDPKPTKDPTQDPSQLGKPTPDVTPEVTEPPVVYKPNQMDLNLSDTKGTIGNLNTYVASLTASMENEYTGIFKGKNLIMISAEAFAAEVIDPVLTPTLYRLATKGINFTDYYQPSGAGTTGGEYQNIFGMLPTSGGKSFKSTADHLNYFTMGNQLNRLGYYGMAFHNNTYTYYDRHKTHVNLGYSEGYMGYGNGMEQYVTKQWPQSDLEMIDGTLDLYIDKQPFNVYYMSVSGHGGYAAGSNAMTKKNWERVANLNYSDAVKGYLAANLELEDALTHLVTELENRGIADNTVICISADHFPYGLDNDAALGDMPYLSELYGYEVKDIFQRDHSRLILWCGSLEKAQPIVVDSPTSSLDILPTLSNLFGTEFDSRLMPGRDVFSDAPALVFNMSYDWKTDYGTYYAAKGFVPKDENITLPEGYVDTIKAIVRNKVRYCEGVLDNDYFAHLFN